jgi:hypothetical protein
MASPSGHASQLSARQRGLSADLLCKGIHPLWRGSLSPVVADEMAQQLQTQRVRLDPDGVSPLIALCCGRPASEGGQFKTREQSDATALVLLQPMFKSCHHVVCILPTGGMSRGIHSS